MKLPVITSLAALLSAAFLFGAAAPVQAQSTDSLQVADSLLAHLKQHPGDVRARIKLAERLVAEDHQEEAIEEYERVLQADSSRLLVLRRLTDLYSWNERPEKALEAYETLALRAPDDLEVRRELAKRYFWTERPEAGIRQLETIVRQRPDDLDARRQLAQQYSWNEESGRAMMQYRAILKRDPDDLETAKKLAQQLLWSDQPQEAAILYRRVVAAQPDSMNTRMKLGQALYASDQSQAALDQFEAVLSRQPENVDALLTAGGIQRWNGSWHAGQRRLRRVRELDPDNERARTLLRGLRRQYGPELQARYYRISDSEDLTVEHVPIRLAAYANGHWKYGVHVAQTRVLDGRIDDTELDVPESIRGFTATGLLERSFDTGTTVRAELTATTYTSNWTPLGTQIELEQSLFDRLSATLRYARSEMQKGTIPLEQRIHTDKLGGEIYTQITRRLGLSALANYARYSNGNGRLTGYAHAGYRLLLENPALTLTAAYGYEDTREIYPSSLPYWTPDQLSTLSAGASIEHTLFGWLQLGGGYQLTHQRGTLSGGNTLSNNFSVQLGLVDVGFHNVSVAYAQTGSEAYSSQTLTAQYAYRF